MSHQLHIGDGDEVLRSCVALLCFASLLLNGAGLLGPNIDLYLYRFDLCDGGWMGAKHKRTQADLGNVASALESFKEERGGYPAGGISEVAWALGPAESPDSFFMQEVPDRDGWGRRIFYRATGIDASTGLASGYVLASLGCDGRLADAEAIDAGEMPSSPWEHDLVIVDGVWVPDPRPDFSFWNEKVRREHG